ncbi:MAG: hypothetical protein WAS21_23630 [Geminicoccaceae bacterium]
MGSVAKAEVRLATCIKLEQTMRWMEPRSWAAPAALSAAVAFGAMALPDPTWAEERDAQYSLHNGTITGPAAEQTAVTILIDQKNGRTWMLAQGESVQWLEIPFAPHEPEPASPN